MTVLLPGWENWGRPQIIVIRSTQINYLCASAARCGKSVSMLGSNKGSMWVLSCVRVCVWCGWSPITEMLVWDDGGGVYGPSGIHVSIPACLYPLCLGCIIVNLQSINARNKNLVWVCSFGGFVSPLCYLFLFDIVAGVAPAGWTPAFWLTTNFV